MQALFLAIAWKVMWILIATAAVIGVAHAVDRFGGPIDSGFCGEHV